MHKNMDQPILAITTNGDPWFPRSLAKGYLFVSDYDPNAVTEYGQPALGFILAGYGSEGVNNEEILQLSQQFIDKGADVNQRHNGLTLLQEAIVANEPVLVEHLLQNKADPNIRIKHPGKRGDNMTTLEFAEYLASLKKDDFSSIVELLKKQPDPAAPAD